MIAKTVLVDTGPLVALFHHKDEHHARCVEQAKELPETLVTCWPVITEASYLLRASRNGVSALLSQVDRGRLSILPLSESDVRPVLAILERYQDQQIDLADACLTHLAEREAIRHVFTLDRRHFSVLRTTTGRALDVLPAGQPIP